MSRLCSAILLAAMMPFAATAAPSPKESDAAPQLMIRVQSVDELARRATEFMKAMLPPEIYKNFSEESGIEQLSMLPVLDRTKPAGVYASVKSGILKGDFDGSQLVVMIPVKSEKEAIDLLKGMGAKIQEKDGLYTIPVPSIPLPVYARFSEGYAYVGIGASTSIDANRLIAPSLFFAEKETAALALSIRFDRIPKEIKEMASPILSAAPLAIKPQLPRELKTVEPLIDEFFIMIGRWTKMISAEGRDVTFRFDLNPKQLTTDFEITVEGMTKSQLNELIAAYKPAENRFASLLTPETAAYFGTKFPLFTEELRRGFSKSAENIGKQLTDSFPEKNGGKEAKVCFTALFDSISKSTRSGNADFLVAFNGPNKEGNYQLIGAIQLEDALPLEKTFIALMKTAPKDIQEVIKLEAEKLDKVVVHDFDIATDPMLQKVFGKKGKLSVCFTEEGVFAALGSDNSAALKSALSAKKAKLPVFDMQVKPKQFTTLLKSLGLDSGIGMLEMTIINQEAITVARTEVEGGEKLKIKFQSGVLLPMMVGGVAYSTGAAAPKAVPIKK